MSIAGAARPERRQISTVVADGMGLGYDLKIDSRPAVYEGLDGEALLAARATDEITDGSHQHLAFNLGAALFCPLSDRKRQLKPLGE